MKLKGLPGRSREWFEANYPELHLPASLNGTGWWNRPFEAEEERQPRADQAADVSSSASHESETILRLPDAFWLCCWAQLFSRG